MGTQGQWELLGGFTNVLPNSIQVPMLMLERGLRGRLGEVQRGAEPPCYLLFFQTPHTSSAVLSKLPLCRWAESFHFSGVGKSLSYTHRHRESEAMHLHPNLSAAMEPRQPLPARAAAGSVFTAWFSEESRQARERGGCVGLNAKRGCRQQKGGSGKRTQRGKMQEEKRQHKKTPENFPKVIMVVQESAQIRRMQERGSLESS